MEVKKCSQCNTSKPLHDFAKDSRVKSGKKSLCKSCDSKRCKQYYQENKEALLISQSLYYQENKEQRAEASKDYRERTRHTHVVSRMLIRARQRAKRLEIPFNLTKSDIVVPTNCPILGFELQSNEGVGHNPNSPSLDRIVPHLGYVVGNIQVISKQANTMKNSADWEQLVLFAKWVLDMEERNKV